MSALLRSAVEGTVGDQAPGSSMQNQRDVSTTPGAQSHRSASPTYLKMLDSIAP